MRNQFIEAQAGEGFADSGYAPLERPTVGEVGLSATGLGTEQLDTVVVELVDWAPRPKPLLPCLSIETR